MQPVETPVIILIAAMSKNRVIGYKKKIPWNLPEDLIRFKQLTMGHAIFMGRKTFESIGKPLPGRTNFVISRDERLKISNVHKINSIEHGLAICAKKEKVFIIGGQQIYEAALPLAHQIELTIIDSVYKGDTFFPKLNEKNWESRIGLRQVSKNLKLEFHYETYLRVESTRTSLGVPEIH